MPPTVQASDKKMEKKTHQPCSDCGSTSSKHMIETYVATTNLSTVVHKDLCGECLIGHDVPVFRACGGWQFGTVKEYDGTRIQKPFFMSFIQTEEDEEWCKISPNPSAEYLSSLNLPQGIIGSFSSSSFSEMSSNNFDFNQTKPLFHEEKVIHLDRTDSWSSFEHDEHIFSDDDNENVEIVLRPRSIVPRGRPRTSRHNPHTPPPKRNSRSKSTGRTKSGTIRKKKEEKKDKSPRSPRMWTKAEDRKLLSVVDSFNRRGVKIIKWNAVATELDSNRNGKQCRERYINHLSPDLNKNAWSPVEDHNLFSSFFKFGRRWSQVSAVLPGRTDNGTKNRFHHLRRKLQRDLKNKSDEKSSIAVEDSIEAIEESSRKISRVLAAESKRDSTYSYIKGYEFGPFVSVSTKKKVQCKRCGLFMPSKQTGSSMCTATKWCEACTRLPPYLSPTVLHECLQLRKEV